MVAIVDRPFASHEFRQNSKPGNDTAARNWQLFYDPGFRGVLEVVTATELERRLAMRGRTITIGMLGFSLLGVAGCAAQEPATTQQTARSTAVSASTEPHSPGQSAAPAAATGPAAATATETGQPVPDMAGKLVREIPESFIGVGEGNTFLVRAEGMEKAKQIVGERFPLRVDGRLSYGQVARYRQLLEGQGDEVIGGESVSTFVAWRDYGVTLRVNPSRWSPERRDALRAMAVKLATQLAKEFNLSAESAQAMKKGAENAHITPNSLIVETQPGKKG